MAEERRWIYVSDILRPASTPASVKATVARCARAGFTDMFLHVWNGAGICWPSPSIESMDPAVNTTFDQALEFINRCKDANIRVHAWMTVSLRGSGFQAQYAPAGTPTNFFNLWLPSFRTYIANIVREYLSRYEFDGIHYDYMRTGGIWTGATAEAQYNTDTGRTYSTDYAIWNPNPWSMLPMDDWMVTQTEATLTALNNQVEITKPGLIRSAWGDASTYEYREGRNIKKWLNNKDIEYAFTGWYGVAPSITLRDRTYTSYNDTFTTLPAPYSVKRLVMVINNYNDAITLPQTSAELRANIDKVQVVGANSGIGLYFYQGESTLWFTDAQLRTILEDY